MCTLILFMHCVYTMCIIKSNYWWTSCHVLLIYRYKQWTFLVSLSMVPRLTNNGNSIKHSHFILWVSITLTAIHTSTRRSLDIPGGTWMPRREHRGGSSRPWSQWGRREMRFSRSQRGWLHCIRRGSTSSSSCLENKKIHNWQNVISLHANALLHLLKMSVEVLIKHITTLHIPWTQHTKHHLASISHM